MAIVGAHLDDPEPGCGGLMALLTREGHEVVVGYLTCLRCDRKIGREPEATARQREAPAAGFAQKRIGTVEGGQKMVGWSSLRGGGVPGGP